MAIPTDLFARIDAWIRERMAAFRAPALTLALFDREQVLHEAAFGAHAPGVPLTLDSRFAIGSIGKSFAGIAAVQLAEAGALDLDAPVTRYLPWLTPRSRWGAITPHHLLTHTAGIVRGTDFAADARAEVWALRETETGFAPGTRFSYSDVGYKALGLVLEAASGMSYGELITRQILDPLGMHATLPALTHAARPAMARGYRPLFDDRPAHSSYPLVPAPWVETNSADGALLSTAADMALYGRMLLNGGQHRGGRLLSPAGFRLLTTEHATQDSGWRYGYGLDRFDIGGIAHVGHGGDMPGYEAYLWLDMDDGVGVVVLAAQPYPLRTPFAALAQLRAAVRGDELPPLPPQPDPTRHACAERCAGTYRSPEGAEIRFEADGERLWHVTDGERVAVEWLDEMLGLVAHPAWELFPLQFVAADDAEDGPAVELLHGPAWYCTDAYAGPSELAHPREWERLTGHYRAHNPWSSNFRVVLRRGALLLVQPGGDEEPLTPLGDDRFVVGDDEHSPERLVFDQVVDGQAWRATLSGAAYHRFFTP